MIQELFGGGASPLIGSSSADQGERSKFGFNNGGRIILEGTPAANNSPSPSPAASPSSSSSAAAAALTTTASNPETQQNNLKCPRCDSSNTKFCYYNNYNLTQPRHFCKTCRRYWTKGGALRNVPIGGGCRKNKTSTHVVSSSVTKSSTVAKFKVMPPHHHHLMGGFEAHHELPSNAMLWAPPQSSQILALLRGNPLNPNPNPNPSPMKQEGSIFGPGAGNGLGLGLDPLITQLPSLGLCGSFWRNNNGNHHHQMAFQQNHHGYQPSEVQNQSAMQALYQRIKLSTGDDNSQAPNQNINMVASSSSQPPPMATTSADQMVYWSNTAPTFCWSDLPTTTSNGAYP